MAPNSPQNTITITIMERTGTSGTATARGTVPILYGCLIPLVLLNLEWWGGGVGVGIQGHIAANTVNATTGVGGGGKFIEELDRAANGY